MHLGKCFFGLESRLLLRHIVSRTSIEVDLDKVQVMLALLTTKNLPELTGFVGCVEYYRRFIEDYAWISSSLIELLKKEMEYVWRENRQGAFEEPKKRLVTAPILAPPD